MSAGRMRALRQAGRPRGHLFVRSPVVMRSDSAIRMYVSSSSVESTLSAEQPTADSQILRVHSTTPFVTLVTLALPDWMWMRWPGSAAWK